MRWSERQHELLDGLMVLLAEVGDPRGRRVPAVVVEFVDDLTAGTAGMSARGHAGEGGRRLGVVSEGMSPDDAGRVVGLSGRQVRRLCTAGVVRHDVVGGRYVVDVGSLRRHLAGRAS